MRKLIALSLAILLIGGVAFAVTPGYRLSPGTGDIMRNSGQLQSDPHKKFRMVRYVPVGGTANSISLTVDSVVIWDLVSDDAVTVTESAQSQDSAVAGVITQIALTPETLGKTSAQDRGKRNWTWLQTYGEGQADLDTDETCAAGDAIGASDAKGRFTTYQDGGTNPRRQGILGFAYDAVSTAGTSNTDLEIFIMTE